jgi:NitT/TauT family transport system substrate-binding protein
MKLQKKVVAVLGASALALTATVGVQSAKAADSSLVKIEVGGLSKQIYLPFMLAQQLGFYKRYGANVELVDEPAGGDATNDMVAGGVQLTGGFFDHTIDLQILGKSAESVAVLLKSPGEVELCRADLQSTIKTPADWKGGVKVGVTGLGSSTNFITRAIGAAAGVPAADMHSVVIGAGATFIAAFKNKTVDCGMTTEPTISAVLQQKLGYVLTDMRYGDLTKAALGHNYVATTVYGMTDWINSHKTQVQAIVNAMYDTMAWIDSHTPTEITKAMPADYYSGVGIDTYVKALTDEKVMYNPGIRMPIGAALGVLRAEEKGRIAYGSWTAAKVKALNLDATYTNSFANTAVAQVKAFHVKAKTKVGQS